MSVKIDELFYELELRTQGFEDSLQRSQTAMTNFTKFMKGNPILVAGAVGAAIAAVGTKAVLMAEEFENAARRINRALPSMAGNVDQLKESITALAIETGISAKELTDAGLAIAQAGVSGQDVLLSRLRVVRELADATGASLTAVAGGMDLIMDEFGIAEDQFRETAAALFTITRGKTSVDELFGALHFAAPTVHNLGLEFEDTANAMAYLIDKGYKARAAGSEIKQLGELGAEGAAQLKKLAEAGAQVRDSMSELETAAADAADTMGRKSARIREEFNAALRELGDDILPHVTEGLLLLAEALGSKVPARLRFDEELKFLDELAARAKKGQTSFEDFRSVMATLYDFRNLSPDQFKQLAPQFEKMDVSQLEDVERNLAIIRDRMIAVNKAETGSGTIDLVTKGRVASLENFRKLLEARITALRQLQTAANINAPPKPTTPADSGPTADQIKAAQEAAARAHEADKEIAEEKLAAYDKQQAKALEVAQQTQQLFDAISASARQLSASVAEGIAYEYDQMLLGVSRAMAAGQNVSDETFAALNALGEHVKNLRLFEQTEQDVVALETRMEQLRSSLGGADTSSMFDMLPGLEERARLEEQVLSTITKGTTDYKKQEDLLKRIRALIKEILGLAGSADGGKSQAEIDRDAWNERLSKMRETAAAIQNAAVGALQLAEAFGGVNEETARTLENLVQIGTQLPQLIAMIQSLSTATKASTGDIIGAALGVLGGIASLFSNKPDPEEERRKEVQRKNTEAIRDLTRHVGELGVVLGSVSGEMFAGVQQALSKTVGQAGALGNVLGNFQAPDILTAQLKALGLDMSDLREIAQGLGIEFAKAVPTLGEMQKLLEAINATELAQFADTYAGKLQALRLEFELFDIENPIDQLKRLQQAVVDAAGGAGDIFGRGKEVFAGFDRFDLGTQAGRDAAEAYLQAILKGLSEGTISAEQLGGLSTSELLDILKELEGLIDEANKTSAPQGETQGFNVSRTITEAQGSVVISTLTTIAYWQEALYKLLSGGGTVTGTLQPPSIIPSVPQGSTATYDVTVYLNITGVLDAAQATDMGTKVVDGMAAQLDALYGAKLRTRQLLSGDVTRY